MPDSRSAHVALFLAVLAVACGGRVIGNETQPSGSGGGSGGVVFVPGAGGTVASGGMGKAGDDSRSLTGGSRLDAQADVGIGGYVDARIDVGIDVAADAPADARIDAPADVASDAPWPCTGTEAGSTTCSATLGVTVLACGQSQPTNVLVSGSVVYWSTWYPDNVMRVSVRGGTATALPKTRHMPEDFAVDDICAYIAYDDGGTIVCEPLPDKVPVELTTGQAVPVGVAVDSACVYWGNSSGFMIKKMPVGGGAPIKVADAVRPADLALDADNVYWTDSGLNAVMKVPKTGGTAVALASATDPKQIAVGGGSVAWTEAHRVVLARTDGSVTGTFDMASLSCNDVAIDGAWLYFACAGGSSSQLMRSPLNGGTVETVASGCDFLSITVDATDVYWTSSDGTVARTPKP